MKDVHIAIHGLDDIGRNVAELMLARRAYYASAYNANVRLVAICGTTAGIADDRGLRAEHLEHLEAGDAGSELLLSSKPDILIETGGSDVETGEPDFSYLYSALAGGCDIVFLSPAALVHGGRDLRDCARKTGSMLKVSGAIAAALPTIDMLQYSLAGCEVTRLDAIFNSTTNYLLDVMIHCGLTLREALDEAEKAGLVDRHIHDEIQGADAARKLRLLASFGLGADLETADLIVHGLESVTEADIANWRRQAAVPRLVGTLTRDDGHLKGRVGVRAYLPGDPMALVRGGCTAFRVVTREMGETLTTHCGFEPGAIASTALKDVEHLLGIRSGSVPKRSRAPSVAR